jgi:hypothetical protein
MARYDTRLAVERGQVRSGMSPNRNDYWADAGYARDYRPPTPHHWRRPDELRGFVRGGAAFSYGYGRDRDVVQQGGRYGRDFRRGYDRELRGRGGTYFMGGYSYAADYRGPRRRG